MSALLTRYEEIQKEWKIREWKTALRIYRGKNCYRDMSRVQTQEEEEEDEMVYEKVNCVIWKHSRFIMQEGDEELKRSMIEYADECEQIWNGTKFIYEGEEEEDDDRPHCENCGWWSRTKETKEE